MRRVVTSSGIPLRQDSSIVGAERLGHRNPSICAELAAHVRNRVSSLGVANVPGCFERPRRHLEKHWSFPNREVAHILLSSVLFRVGHQTLKTFLIVELFELSQVQRPFNN